MNIFLNIERPRIFFVVPKKFQTVWVSDNLRILVNDDILPEMKIF